MVTSRMQSFNYFFVRTCFEVFLDTQITKQNHAAYKEFEAQSITKMTVTTLQVSDNIRITVKNGCYGTP